MSVFMKLERKTKREHLCYYEGVLEGLEIARKSYLEILNKSIVNIFSNEVNTKIELHQSIIVGLRIEAQDE